MGSVIAWVILAIAALIGVAIWWRFSLRRRLDSRMHDAPPEERQALMDIQRDIDRGRAARQGFFF